MSHPKTFVSPSPIILPSSHEFMYVTALLFNTVYCLGRIKLKIADDDKFLGVVDGKLQPVEYNDALSIKLNTMKDISVKNLESRDGNALTETGFWFFPKSFSMKGNKKSSKQGFRIVYYAPEEYLLMRGDNCLGFKDGNKLKKVDCTLDKATRFRICENRLCDNYMEILKGMNCIMSMLKDNMYNGGSNRPTGWTSPDKFSPWGGYDDDSDSDDGYNCKDYVDGYNNKYGYNGKYGNKGKGHGPLDGSHLLGYNKYPNNNYMC